MTRRGAGGDAADPGVRRGAGRRRWTRLGGLTNRVYRVRAGGEALVLRIPGEGTEAYIDRAVEAVNARAAAAAGVSPEVLHVDPARGLMVTRYVEGADHDAGAFRSLPGAPARGGGGVPPAARQRRAASPSASSCSR